MEIGRDLCVYRWNTGPNESGGKLNVDRVPESRNLDRV